LAAEINRRVRAGFHPNGSPSPAGLPLQPSLAEAL